MKALLEGRYNVSFEDLRTIAIGDDPHWNIDAGTAVRVDPMIHDPMTILRRETDADLPVCTIGKPHISVVTQIGFGKARCPSGEEFRPPNPFV